MKLFRILLLFAAFNLSYSQQLDWAQHFGQDKSQWIKAIVIDNEGNSYAIGKTEAGTTDLDPGPGVFNLTHPGVQWSGQADIFIVKLDPDGNFLWGKGLADTYNSSNSAESIVIDPNGNIYTLMITWDTISTITIKKFNSNGNELMSRDIMNLNTNQNSNILSHSFDVDDDENIYVTGYFYNTVTLDNNNAEFTLQTSGLGNYTLKLDASGQIVWVKEFLDNPSFSFAHQIKVHPDGNLNLLVGTEEMNSEQTAYDFGQILYKIDSSDGHIIWSKSFEKQMPSKFTIAPDGNIIIASTFENNVIDVDPSGAEHLISPNNTYTNMYFLWLTADGEYIDVLPYLIEWQDPYITDIEVDEDNNYYFTGVFTNDVDMDPGAGVFTLTSESDQDAMVIQFNADRSFENAYKFGNNSVFNIADIETMNGFVYLAGHYIQGVDFDPGPDELWLSSEYNGIIGGDGYILKISQCNLDAPIGDFDQYFCNTSVPEISDLSPSSGISWYDSPISSTPLNEDQILIDGNIYYAARVQNCPDIPNRLAVTVHLTPQPSVPVTQNQQFCSPQNATIANLSATGTGINWYASASGGPALSLSTPLVNGQTYYASQTVNGCESFRSEVTVTISTTPTATAISPQSFCAQQNATVADLIITGTDIKLYDQPASGNLISPSSLLSNQVYYCTQTLNGCESQRVPITVNLINTPQPTASENQSFCSGNGHVLSDLSISGQNIQWYDAATGGNLLSSSTQLDDSTYYATQTIDGCESTMITVNVSLNDPNFPVANYTAYICDDLNTGLLTADLSIYNENLVANSSDYNINYYTSFSAAQNETPNDLVSNPNNFTFPSGITTIYARIVSSGGCYKVAELNLNLNEYNEPQIDSEYFICETESVNIEANGPFDSYVWSTGSTLNYTSISQPGNYWVKGITIHGDEICEATRSFTVSSLPSPQISDIDIIDWNSANNQITIYTTSDNPEFSIDGANFKPENVFSGLEPGVYTVYVRNGCGIDKEKVVLLDYPRYFSPNGDGANDYWNLDYAFFGSRIDVIILDRYGKTLAKINNSSQGWDGTYNNIPMPATDYWFIATRFDGKIYKGHFSLIR